MASDISSERGNYALPLFALVDRDKVDLRSGQLPELAEHLEAFMRQNLGIELLDGRIEQLGEEAFFVLNGVESSALPALFALADVQKGQLYRYQREENDLATLTPLAVDPTKDN
jgi:hypothetical protein